jgi:L-ascorbate metabolism protein UlaG (beta-lactamase superfamily)
MAAQVSSTSVKKDGLEFTYFGAAGWKITDGAITVLVDPYISRLQYTDRSHPDDDRKAYRRDEVEIGDTEMIDQLISDADFILILSFSLRSSG